MRRCIHVVRLLLMSVLISGYSQIMGAITNNTAQSNKVSITIDKSSHMQVFEASKIEAAHILNK